MHLPRGRCPNADADGRFLALRDSDERRFDLNRRSLQRINHSEHVTRRNVSRADVNDAHEGGAGADGVAPEGQVVRDDDPVLTRGVFEELRIASTEQMFVAGTADVAAADSQPLDDGRNDVFVCEEGEIERLHAVILSSHVCSPLSASAAYRNAAAKPSGVS